MVVLQMIGVAAAIFLVVEYTVLFLVYTVQTTINIPYSITVYRCMYYFLPVADGTTRVNRSTPY